LNWSMIVHGLLIQNTLDVMHHEEKYL
jgi:hypothetical protein